MLHLGFEQELNHSIQETYIDRMLLFVANLTQSIFQIMGGKERSRETCAPKYIAFDTLLRLDYFDEEPKCYSR